MECKASLVCRMMSVGEVLRKAGIVSDVIDQPPDLQIQVSCLIFCVAISIS